MSNWYFNPIIAQIGPVSLHWYGLMYSLGFLAAYLWLIYSKMGKNLRISAGQKETLLMVLIAGVLFGGRIGYILFYNLSYYISFPLKIFAVWEGGMSFHGGLIGVALALVWFSKKYKVAGLALADTVSSIAPLGLFFGRFGNFINGELYGRIAGNDFISQKVCLYFPADPQNCRYPSQLFESLLEGLLLFIILWLIGKMVRQKSTHHELTNLGATHEAHVGVQNQGLLSASFLILYGLFRFLLEFWREPDPQLGFILINFLTMGQLLSALMILVGVVLAWKVLKNDK